MLAAPPSPLQPLAWDRGDHCCSGFAIVPRPVPAGGRERLNPMFSTKRVAQAGVLRPAPGGRVSPRFPCCAARRVWHPPWRMAETGGDADARDDRTRWRVMPVEELPCPHHLFKCDLESEHRAILEAVCGGVDWPSADERRRAFDLFAERFGDRIPACGYHEPDWHVAAAAAIKVAESGQADGGLFDYADVVEEAAKSNGVDPATEWALWSFFEHPIFLDGPDDLGNGQHRVCAMKIAGVFRCPVES